jgi:hypothetical protein
MKYQALLDQLIPCLGDTRDEPLTIPWPSPGNIGGFRSFQTVSDWREFVLDLSLNRLIPDVVAIKFQRAQKLFFLGWIDPDLIKAGELVSLTALELALKDRYGSALKDRYRMQKGKEKRRVSLQELLNHMVEEDGLTDDKLPTVQRCGGTVVRNLYETKAEREKRKGSKRMTIVEIRNSLAHGDPFDALPWGGLLEIVRDLIDYAYRDWVGHAPTF